MLMVEKSWVNVQQKTFTKWFVVVSTQSGCFGVAELTGW
jgi:hypothetical protein